MEILEYLESNMAQIPEQDNPLNDKNANCIVCCKSPTGGYDINHVRNGRYFTYCNTSHRIIIFHLADIIATQIGQNKVLYVSKHL